MSLTFFFNYFLSLSLLDSVHLSPPSCVQKFEGRKNKYVRVQMSCWIPILHRHYFLAMNEGNWKSELKLDLFSSPLARFFPQQTRPIEKRSLRCIQTRNQLNYKKISNKKVIKIAGMRSTYCSVNALTESRKTSCLTSPSVRRTAVS